MLCKVERAFYIVVGEGVVVGNTLGSVFSSNCGRAVLTLLDPTQVIPIARELARLKQKTDNKIWIFFWVRFLKIECFNLVFAATMRVSFACIKSRSVALIFFYTDSNSLRIISSCECKRFFTNKPLLIAVAADFFARALVVDSSLFEKRTIR